MSSAAVPGPASGPRRRSTSPERSWCRPRAKSAATKTSAWRRSNGQSALREEHARGAARQIVGLTINWEQVEALYEKLQLPPQVPATASRQPVPVYKGGGQVGRATSTTWSPVLKKMIALATVERESAKVGSEVEMEVTVEAVRHRVGATVTSTPFFNPPRKTSSIS